MTKLKSELTVVCNTSDFCNYVIHEFYKHFEVSGLSVALPEVKKLSRHTCYQCYSKTFVFGIKIDKFIYTMHLKGKKIGNCKCLY